MICLTYDFVTMVIQDNVGFGWGFGIPGAVMILAIITFNAGSLVYRYKVPRGSPLTSVAQVLVASVRKRKATAGNDNSYLYEGLVQGQRPVELLAHTNQYRYVLLIHSLSISYSCLTAPLNARPLKHSHISAWNASPLVKSARLLIPMFLMWSANTCQLIELEIRTSL